MISINVADGRLQAGMVGLIKSGKSTTLNALMKTQILPEAIQPETAAEVRIIHSTRKEHKSGQLLGGEDIEIAAGSEKIHALLRQYNELARKGKWLPYDSLTLRIPLPFLKESVLKFSLEISDTAGPDEAGATDATLRSLSTMERLSVFIIVLNYRRMKSQQELELLTHLRDHHPQLLETHERFLFIVNAVDAYYDDGNKYSIHPKDVHGYVQTYLKDTLHVTIPTERIVPFSAKWALLSHLWHEHPESISNAGYMMAAGLMAKIQDTEPPKSMRIPSLENKKVVASYLKDFSGIRELEPKLYRMLGINGPAILYTGAIDDTIAHISTLKKHVHLEKERCDITGATATLHLHEQISEALSQAISNSEQTMQNLAKELEDYSGRSIFNWTFALQDDLSNHIASLSSESRFTDPDTVSDQILKPADRIMERTWSSIMSNLTGELRRNVEVLFSALGRRIKHIENTHNVKLKLGKLDFDKLEKSPPFTFKSAIPSSINPLTVSALKERDIGIEWAIQFRKNTEAAVSKLFMKNFSKAQKGCRTRVEKVRNEQVDKIKHSRQVLEAKQNRMESLNQKAYQLETVHRQLLAAREEYQMAEEEEEEEEEKKPTVEVKKVKPEDRKTSGTSSQSHFRSPVMLLLNAVVVAAYILLL